MAKVLRNPFAVQDMEHPIPFVQEDIPDEVETFDEFEEFDGYDTPGRMSIDEALISVQAILETESDPAKREIYMMQKAELEKMAGLDSQDSADFEEFEDYETPGAMSIEEALDAIHQARSNGIDDPVRDSSLAEQEAQLQGMVIPGGSSLSDMDGYRQGAPIADARNLFAGVGMGGQAGMPGFTGVGMGGQAGMPGWGSAHANAYAHANIPEYSVPRNAPPTPPAGVEALKPFPANQDQGIVASMTAGITKVVDGFVQQQRKVLEQFAKPEAVKDELVEFEDYETPGSLSREEALVKANEAMANADNEKSRQIYAEQVAGLEKMGSVDVQAIGRQGLGRQDMSGQDMSGQAAIGGQAGMAGGAGQYQAGLQGHGSSTQVNIPEYSTPLSAPPTPPTPPAGAKVLKPFPTNQGQGIEPQMKDQNVSNEKPEKPKEVEKTEKVDKVVKVEPIKKAEKVEPIKKPAKPVKVEKSVGTKTKSAPVRSRDLPDLSGLKTHGPLVSLELN